MRSDAVEPEIDLANNEHDENDQQGFAYEPSANLDVGQGESTHQDTAYEGLDEDVDQGAADSDDGEHHGGNHGHDSD
jgi:hypothetical protein